MAARLTRAQQQERTRERLLDEAETLFGDRGIHGTSLDEVAAAAGLTKGAIYANFRNKRDLIAAILARKLGDDGSAAADGSHAGWARTLADDYEAGLEQPAARRFALVFVELWLFGMRDESTRGALTQWLRTLRDSNRDEVLAHADHELGLPAEQIAALMTALDIGVALQHFIDPERVPAGVYKAGVEAILGAGLRS